MENVSRIETCLQLRMYSLLLPSEQYFVRIRGNPGTAKGMCVPSYTNSYLKNNNS